MQTIYLGPGEGGKVKLFFHLGKRLLPKKDETYTFSEQRKNDKITGWTDRASVSGLGGQVESIP